MKILIGADIVPTKTNIEAFLSGNIDSIIDENIEKSSQRRIFVFSILKLHFQMKKLLLKNAVPT